MSEVDRSPSDAQYLATLVHLGRRTREAKDPNELAFIAVNETHLLTPYRQAALWLNTSGIAALSGVVSPEANAPYVQWLTRIVTYGQKSHASAEPFTLGEGNMAPEDLAEWHEWLPSYALWLPLRPVGDRFSGGVLLLARDNEWSAAEIALLVEWSATWSHARAFLGNSGFLGLNWGHAAQSAGTRTGRWPTHLLFSKKLWLSLVVLFVLFLSVPLTVLAPAELVPVKPATIRAPLDGVLDHVLVVPNQAVKEGDPLFAFDRENIQNRLQVALSALATAQAEYRQKAQEALFDSNSKSQLAVVQGQIAEKATDVTYLRKLKERGTVTAPRSGIVLFDDPTDWVGRPVVTGERVMAVADEHSVEVEAWLAPDDAIPLALGSKVTLYLNANPLHPLFARLNYIAYEAIERPDGKYAYRVRATLDANQGQSRIGLKGTAKLEGGKVFLVYWILRRPFSAARIWLGI